MKNISGFLMSMISTAKLAIQYKVINNSLKIEFPMKTYKRYIIIGIIEITVFKKRG
jgi:hypothetical protein